MNSSNATNGIYIAESKELWIILSGFIILTNTFLFVCLMTSKSNRTSSDTILTSTFLIGMLFGLYIIPRRVVFTRIRQVGIACSILRQSGQLLMLNYNLHQCFISLDRYFAVNWAVKYRNKVHKLLYRRIIVGIWVFSIVFSYVPLITFRITSLNRFIRYSESNLERIYNYWKIICGYYLPFLIIIICYAKIFYTFFRLRSKPTISPYQHRFTPSVTRKTIYASAQMGILAMLFIMMTLSNTSSFLLRELRIIPTEWYYRLHNIAISTLYVTYSYPALNPLLYAYFIDSIRSAVLKKVKAIKHYLIL